MSDDRKPVGIEPADEYRTLRDELVVARRYVFERPVAILLAGIAGAAAADGPLVPLFPLGVGGLLLFNFWFTTNRLRSTARITAYIQVALEEYPELRGPGWETALRAYRRWTKSGARAGPKIDEGAIPDSVTYYGPIFGLHVALMAMVGAASVFLLLPVPTALPTLCAAGTFVVMSVFGVLCLRNSPRATRSLIERSRSIWIDVLGSARE